MPKYPQCPRCGDNLSELAGSWSPNGIDGPNPVCSVCIAEIHRKGAPEAPTVDVQDEIEAAATNAPATTRTGGYAFPVSADEFYQRGMTLRDYFAAQCVTFFAKLVDDRSSDKKSVSELHAKAAELAYGLADAMIRERDAVRFTKR
jgi:hypothetical protein